MQCNATWKNIVSCSHVANEEYYQMLMINESYPCGLDTLSYTVEEIESITTEYIMNNAVSILAHLCVQII